MLFNEIYGSYFAAVSEILRLAVRGELTDKKIYDITAKTGFAESHLSIPEKLRNGEWALLDRDLSTPLMHEPKMPLSTLERRWLRTIADDPRIKLFDPCMKGLEDIEPLFDRNSVVYFDRYSDGDPFDDDRYIAVFRTILRALKEKRTIEVSFVTRKGRAYRWTVTPLFLEYSQKDDKFRLQVVRRGRRDTINLARIEGCRIVESINDMTPADEAFENMCKAEREAHIVMEITDDRNALERVMLHFSHLKKETVKISEDIYRMDLYYDKDDETEILIRVLEFGPVVRVISPDSFIDLIRKRLVKQRRLDHEIL